MPAQLVHLGVGSGLSVIYLDALAPDFFLGSISPDAIHMRPGSTREDKRETHLYLNEPGYVRRVHKFIDTRVAQHPNDALFWYGYASHLLTDFYWLNRVFIPFKNEIDPMMTRQERNRLYYQECEWNEVRLYNTKPWREQAWKLLQDAKQVHTSILSSEELHQWKVHVLHAFDDVGTTSLSETLQQPQYITAALVDDFIPDAVNYVASQFRCFQWVGESSNN